MVPTAWAEAIVAETAMDPPAASSLFPERQALLEDVLARRLSHVVVGPGPPIDGPDHLIDHRAVAAAKTTLGRYLDALRAQECLRFLDASSRFEVISDDISTEVYDDELASAAGDDLGVGMDET